MRGISGRGQERGRATGRATGGGRRTIGFDGWGGSFRAGFWFSCGHFLGQTIGIHHSTWGKCINHGNRGGEKAFKKTRVKLWTVTVINCNFGGAHEIGDIVNEALDSQAFLPGQVGCKLGL